MFIRELPRDEGDALVNAGLRVGAAQRRGDGRSARQTHAPLRSADEVQVRAALPQRAEKVVRGVLDGGVAGVVPAERLVVVEGGADGDLVVAVHAGDAARRADGHAGRALLVDLPVRRIVDAIKT